MQGQWQQGQPLYEQLVSRLVATILEGRLAPGDPLPSVRQLAADMQLNPLTVQRALAQLADLGVVEKRRGIGSFVAEGAREALLARERTRFLEETWPRIREEIKRLGLNPGTLLQTLEGVRDGHTD
ncbi:GntR family transcriptional regulator [Gallaecimonas kandeliae]|uniref:GntR family transcriptional regulator n=1 Tax=Gallaecimonas kandeliae TaxID=3029055 RepID=UPI00264729FC|nr:GntR family transcriptional regulator [Gallaecimonas kandeliae]WKE67206.1 GntR family transcriptional regulator [Gallaecimonas kandeliae]